MGEVDITERTGKSLYALPHHRTFNGLIAGATNNDALVAIEVFTELLNGNVRTHEVGSCTEVLGNHTSTLVQCSLSKAATAQVNDAFAGKIFLQGSSKSAATLMLGKQTVYVLRNQDFITESNVAVHFTQQIHRAVLVFLILDIGHRCGVHQHHRMGNAPFATIELDQRSSTHIDAGFFIGSFAFVVAATGKVVAVALELVVFFNCVGSGLFGDHLPRHNIFHGVRQHLQLLLQAFNLQRSATGGCQVGRFSTGDGTCVQGF